MASTKMGLKTFAVNRSDFFAVNNDTHAVNNDTVFENYSQQLSRKETDEVKRFAIADLTPAFLYLI